MSNTDQITVGDTIIYAETPSQSVEGVVTEYDPETNTATIVDIDGKCGVALDLVFWYIVNPADETKH